METELVETNNAPSDASQMMQIIERVALNPDVSMDKMERLLSMQERILDRKSKQEYAMDMAEVQKKLPIIKTETKNTQTGSLYAKLDKINKLCMPIINDGGFVVTFGTDKSEFEHHVGVTCKIMHKNGHSEIARYDSPIDDAGIKGNVNKTPTHARGSTISYGQRYLMKLVFNIIISDEDDDGNRAGINYMTLCQNIVALIPSIAAIKNALLVDNYPSAIEAYKEMTQDEVTSIWVAPTKGGPFTTEERKKMKSEEWHSASKEIYSSENKENE